MTPLQRALARQQAIGDSGGPVWGPGDTGLGGGGHRRMRWAAWLLGAAHRMRRDTGVALIGRRPFHEAHLIAERRVRVSLGTEEYEAAWPRGACAEDAPGPVPEERTSQVRSTRTRTGGSHTPTA
ncbi:hypothetical protein BJ965_000215 [Streptomyces luteogriseus]|uniref:Uncharacterized protein n=1 Tax=Streptomyces luteogriseus TaxID=68233 RepID=A0A7W7DGE2_9ACTN|nr:hypothetical protein [Streptomyces luteogriseus]MBB4710333.1 hypothetical protein [Streptomyces luteogriseus]